MIRFAQGDSLPTGTDQRFNNRTAADVNAGDAPGAQRSLSLFGEGRSCRQLAADSYFFVCSLFLVTYSFFNSHSSFWFHFGLQMGTVFATGCREQGSPDPTPKRDTRSSTLQWRQRSTSARRKTPPRAWITLPLPIAGGFIVVTRAK